MDKNFTALGHELSIHPVAQAREYRADIKRAAETLQRYAEAKRALEGRIIANERWYKLRHWEYVRAKGRKEEQNTVEPASAWLFNSLANKHADAMDNFPEPVFLPREESDEGDAKLLSSVVPAVLERNEFEESWSRGWWYKLKQGCVPYGVFWDKRRQNGLGDISIKKLDMLNIFWEPGITDIQDSSNLFIISAVEREALKAQYPDIISGNETSSIALSEYVHDENLKTFDKAVVVDWYYKLPQGGKTLLHYCKYVGDKLLFSSLDESDEAGEPLYPEGWYAHGQYPLVFDILFPEEDMPSGIGYIDIMREPQLYIDKLDQIIMTNALRAGKSRWFINRSGNVSEEEFADWSRDFVHTNAIPDDKSLREIRTAPLPPFIIAHKQNKIEELKETSGNRDFSQGGTNSGVTAAAAISALQEAGSKLSRDMIKGSYRAYRKLIYMVSENMRQFYDESRYFRIVGERGAAEYQAFSNERLRGVSLPPAYPGEGGSCRQPVFDIVVRAQRQNPFSRAAQNELVVSMYKLGFFSPENALPALAALELMSFEGKEKLQRTISENARGIMR